MDTAIPVFTKVLLVANFDFQWQWATRKQRKAILKLIDGILTYRAVIYLNCDNIPSTCFHAHNSHILASGVNCKLIPAIVDGYPVDVAGSNVLSVARGLVKQYHLTVNANSATIDDIYYTPAEVCEQITKYQQARRNRRVKHNTNSQV